MTLSSSELKEEISKILSRSETTSAKIILTELEKAFETDFTSRKEEIGKLVKEILVENATAETIFYKQMAEKNPQNLIKEWHNSVDNGNYSQSRVIRPLLKIISLLEIDERMINSKDVTQNQKTALHKTAEQGNLTMADYLIRKEAEIDVKDENESTPLHLASRKGWNNIVKILLKNEANINAKDRNESTPLHLALIYGWKNIVETLLENGADINAKDIRGQTPLHCSASQDSVEMAEFLIENKAKLNAKSHRGQTPIHIAASEGKLELVKLLAEHGAVVNDKNVENKSPLDLAIEKGYQEVIKYLLKEIEGTSRVQEIIS